MTTPRQVLFPKRMPLQGLSILQEAEADLVNPEQIKLARKAAASGLGSEDLQVMFHLPRKIAKDIVHGRKK